MNVPGPYTELETDPHGSLALTLLYSQVPRAVLRYAQAENNGVLSPLDVINSSFGPKGKLTEESCLEATYTALHELHPLKFDCIERSFYFLPMLNIESLNSQKVAVARISDLEVDAPRIHRPYFAALREYAEGHLDIITRFGRFPNRNVMMGRTNTPDEDEYLRDECKDWERVLISNRIINK